MNKCTYCGKDYSAGVKVCDVDGRPVVDPDRATTVQPNVPDKIGRSGQWLIFLGTAVAVLGIVLVCTLHHGLNELPKIFGEKVAPYIVFFTPALLGFCSLVLFERCPKRLVVPIGVTGWVIGISLIYWYFWFGPGAFGHH